MFFSMLMFYNTNASTVSLLEFRLGNGQPDVQKRNNPFVNLTEAILEKLKSSGQRKIKTSSSRRCEVIRCPVRFTDFQAIRNSKNH